MARRGNNDFADKRDWGTRATEALMIARAMPEGLDRDEAIRKAEQLRSAAEMKGYLSSSELKAPS